MLPYIKKQFMAFRNGIVADTLRAAGMPYSIIFGLQLPQLSQIARDVTAKLSAGSHETDSKADAAESCSSLDIARRLWDDRNVRESRLLACWLFPHDLSRDEALVLAGDVCTREEADILCFRLLRYLPDSDSLADAIEVMGRDSNSPLIAYCASALRRNLA